MELAAAIVRRYYDQQAAEAAAEEFNRVFRERELPSDMPEVEVPDEDVKEGNRVWLPGLVRLAGCANSNSQARRLIQQGGVSVGPDAESLEVIRERNAEPQLADGWILKVGKKRFFRIRLPS
jgi:tyrosyl-tRNA synthetase